MAMIMTLRRRLGAAESEATKARRMLAEFREREFAGVSPEEVCAARDLAKAGDGAATKLRGKLDELGAPRAGGRGAHQ